MEYQPRKGKVLPVVYIVQLCTCEFTFNRLTKNIPLGPGFMIIKRTILQLECQYTIIDLASKGGSRRNDPGFLDLTIIQR